MTITFSANRDEVQPVSWQNFDFQSVNKYHIVPNQAVFVCHL